MLHSTCTRRWPVLICLLLLTACIPAEGATHIPPTSDCATVFKQRQQPDKPNAIEISVAAHSYREFCWQLYGPLLAAQKVTDYRVRAVPHAYNMIGGAYQQAMEQALDSGNAPDLMQFSSDAIAHFATKGALAPLADCIRKHSEFSDLLAPAWEAVTWHQQRWGIPYQIGLLHFYFNKAKLRKLMSRAELDDLPARIARGAFGLDEMVKTAQKAIATGVVMPGFGYWPNIDEPWTFQLTYVAYGGRLFDAAHQQLVISKDALTKAYTFHRQLMVTQITHPSFADLNHSFLDKTMWEDAVVHGRVLFWVAGNYNKAMLTTEYRDDLEPDQNDLGALPSYALYPSGISGQPGTALVLYTSAYVVPSIKGSGRRNQDVACAVLAKTITPEINALNTARTGFMSVLNAQVVHPAFQADDFSLGQFSLWQHAVFTPHQAPAYAIYTSILNNLLNAVQTGELTPAIAAELAIQQLRNELGDDFIEE